MKKIVFVAAAIAGGITSQLSHGAIIATEDFSYSDGTLAGSGGGTGWSNSWTNVEGSPMLATGAVTIDSVAGGQVGRALSVAQSGDAIIWIRFEGQQITSLSGTTNSYGGLGLYNGGAEQALIGKSWPGDYQWKAGVGGGLIAPATPVSTLALTTVLARVTLNSVGNDILDVWLNPADMSSEAALGPALISRSDADLNFNTIRLRGGSGAGGSESWTFDNVAIATTMTEVVPEPSTALLGGIGLLGLLSRRRRS